MATLVVDETPAYHTPTVFAVVEWAADPIGLNRVLRGIRKEAEASIVRSGLTMISVVVTVSHRRAEQAARNITVSSPSLR